jgi:hypothetical protein
VPVGMAEGQACGSARSAMRQIVIEAESAQPPQN